MQSRGGRAPASPFSIEEGATRETERRPGCGSGTWSLPHRLLPVGIELVGSESVWTQWLSRSDASRPIPRAARASSYPPTSKPQLESKLIHHLGGQSGQPRFELLPKLAGVCLVIERGRWIILGVADEEANPPALLTIAGPDGVQYPPDDVLEPKRGPGRGRSRGRPTHRRTARRTRPHPAMSHGSVHEVYTNLSGVDGMLHPPINIESSRRDVSPPEIEPSST